MGHRAGVHVLVERRYGVVGLGQQLLERETDRQTDRKESETEEGLHMTQY